MSAAFVIDPWQAGIFFDVPEDEYHRRELGVASSHALGEVLRSPAHYRAWLAGDERRTRALDLGKAAHCALLEPDVFARRYVVEPEWGSCRANQEDGTTKEQGKANKARRDAWRAAHVGAQIVTDEDMATILRMRAALARHPEARGLLCSGRSEVTLRWICPDTGLRCKARIDWWCEDVAIACDLKTTEDARRGAFTRDARKYGYRRQAAHYTDGMRELGVSGTFVFIPVEKSGVACMTYRLDSDAMADGRAQIDLAKRTLARCLATNEWSAYGEGDDAEYLGELTDVGLERWEMRNHG